MSTPDDRFAELAQLTAAAAIESAVDLGILASSEGTALQSEDQLVPQLDAAEAGAFDRAERIARSRVGADLATELADVSEVEYRQLRLERVVLAGLWDGATVSQADAEISLRELAALAETAGSTVLEAILQRREHPDPATFLGQGKAHELAGLVARLQADTVVVDGELGPSQRRALEDVVKVKVVDRTAVILDIFASHAKSREGKAQVELAQLEYLLPRLRGWGESMSRQAGGRVAGGAGIGSRGPGETKIELDRRRIRMRMAKLRREIAKMEPARATQRLSRRRGQVPAAVIVGYTNAGKSSLLNQLTEAGVLVDNQLFATLDPTVRRCQTADGRAFTLADTVGFVRSLPHQLVEAFRSTLEEVADADLMIHVVDAAHDDPDGQIKAVHAVLAEVEGALAVPELLVFNKADIAQPALLSGLLASHSSAVAVSAATGQGLAELRERIDEALPRPPALVDVVVPYQRGDLVAATHQRGEVVSQEFTEHGTHLVARVDAALASQLQSL